MKKSAVAVCIILVMMVSVSAEAGIGLKGGMNFTKWTGDDWGNADDFSWKMGYKFGAFFTLPMTPIIKIQPEIYFTSKGWKFDGELLNEEFSLTFNANYIEVPVLLKLDMDAGLSFVPTVFAGPYIGFLMGDPTLEMEYQGQTEEEDVPSDNFNSVDFGGVVGAALDYNLVATTLTLEARYNLGFTSIAKEDTQGEDADVRNMGFSLLAGFSF
ncbi:MAG: porin family protein [Candidatus Krumholzibacteriales bacterium]